MRLRDLFRGRMEDLAFALLGSRPERVEHLAANVQVDRLRATLASLFGFEDVPPDEYIEQAARHRQRRIDLLETRWRAATLRLKALGQQNVDLAFEADGLRRRLADLGHRVEVARQMLHDGNIDVASHHLWLASRDEAIAAHDKAIAAALAPGGGLEHPGSLPGEEVGDG